MAHTDKSQQGTRSGELSFFQQGHLLLHLPAKPSYSCKQHAKIACCARCVPVASFRPLFLLLLLWFFHERKMPTADEPLWHFAIIQKAICRTCRGAKGLRKVELADTLWTVLLAMSCNCKIFFNIYVLLFLYILHSVRYLVSGKDGSLSLPAENKIKLLYVLSLCPVAFIPRGTRSRLVADVCHARLHSQENPHTIPHSNVCSALACAASWAETDPEQPLNTNHKKRATEEILPSIIYSLSTSLKVGVVAGAEGSNLFAQNSN